MKKVLRAFVKQWRELSSKKLRKKIAPKILDAIAEAIENLETL